MAFEASCSVDEEVFLVDQFGRIVGGETREGIACCDRTAAIQFALPG